MTLQNERKSSAEILQKKKRICGINFYAVILFVFAGSM